MQAGFRSMELCRSMVKRKVSVLFELEKHTLNLPFEFQALFSAWPWCAHHWWVLVTNLLKVNWGLRLVSDRTGQSDRTELNGLCREKKSPMCSDLTFHLCWSECVVVGNWCKDGVLRPALPLILEPKMLLIIRQLPPHKTYSLCCSNHSCSSLGSSCLKLYKSR